MQFFELSRGLKKGLTVEMDGRPVVRVDNKILPLGRSLRALLWHPNDRGLPCTLRHGDLHQTTQGLVLVRKDWEEARDGLALVVIRLTPVENGESIRHRHLGKPLPQILQDQLLLFHPYEAVRVDYVSEAYPLSFELRWDGKWMNERSVLLPQRRQAARGFQQATA